MHFRSSLQLRVEYGRLKLVSHMVVPTPFVQRTYYRNKCHLPDRKMCHFPDEQKLACSIEQPCTHGNIFHGIHNTDADASGAPLNTSQYIAASTCLKLQVRGLMLSTSQIAKVYFRRLV